MFRMMFLVLSLLVMKGSAMGEVIINVTIQECTGTDNSLHCNFKNSSHQEVYLNPLDMQLKDIYVQHIKKLHLAESVCANVNFYNISEIVTEGDKNEHCEDGFELLALNSSLNRLPENVKTVSLTFCNMTLLASNKNLEKLIVNKSEIATLSLSGPFNKKPYIELQGSRIVRTEKLVLEDEAEFKVKDSIFEDVQENGFELNPGVTLTLEKVAGQFLFNNLLNQLTHRCNGNESKKSTVYLIIFACSIGVNLMIFAMCAFNKFRLKERYQAKSRDMHEDNTDENIMSDQLC